MNSGNTGKVFIYYGSSNFTDNVPDQVSEWVVLQSEAGRGGGGTERWGGGGREEEEGRERDGLER